jgi:hypothetical protein
MTFKLYFGFGLNIYTNYKWPALFPIEKEISNKESVIIEVNTTDIHNKKSTYSEREFVPEKGKQTIFFHNKKLGSLNAYYGQKVEIIPLKRLREKSKKLLFNWGIATLLHQKGHLVLQGTHLVFNGKSILFMGREEYQTGMVKNCIKSGGHVISEKISVVSFLNDEPFMVPSNALNTDTDHPAKEQLLLKDIKLDYICFLCPEASFSPYHMPKFEAFKKVFYEFYLKLESKHENVMVVHFRNVEKLLNRINVYQLKPPEKEADLHLAAESLSRIK